MSAKHHLYFRAGRFNIHLETNLKTLVDEVEAFYPGIDKQLIDFNVSLNSPFYLNSFIKPKALFGFSNQTPFTPLPLAHAFPLLEWGLNWCVYSHYHEALVLHAAVLEKDGRALILPGEPGAGKSTLSALLCRHKGWRLLSDELTLIDLSSGLIQPNPRPISLKNESIEVVRSAGGEPFFSTIAQDTIKGDVALLRASDEAQQRFNDGAKPHRVIFPNFNRSHSNSFQKVGKAEAFIRLVNQSFNYHILGLSGFESLKSMVDSVQCFELKYSGDVDFVADQLESIDD